MCRIFGFRSVINSQVHHSLVNADNALHAQSQEHPDGWGVAYYVHKAPHIIKSEKTALNDHLFTKVSGIVSSNTVVAHIRNATKGKNNLLNTHPFQFGPWVFAHNGNIKDFDQHRSALLALVNPSIRNYILGDTDSEVIFFILLSQILKRNVLDKDISFPQLKQACEDGIQSIQAIVGPSLDDDKGPSHENYLSLIITNGTSLLAYQGGKQLFFSTHKGRCPERASCAFFSDSCEKPSQNLDIVNHLLISSEPLAGENKWHPLDFEAYIGVDSHMKLFI